MFSIDTPFCLICLSFLGRYVLAFYHIPGKSFDSYGIFYIAAAMYGFGDCTVTTVTASICTSSFASTGQTADAWAVFRSFLGLGALVCFFVSPKLAINGGKTSTQAQLGIELLITGGVLLLSIFGLWMFDKFTLLSKVDAGGDDVQVHEEATAAVIVDGKTVYVSGCTGRGASLGGSELSAPGLAEETQAACNNVKSVLRSAGCSVDAVAKITVYTANCEDDDDDSAVAEKTVAEVCAHNFAPEGALLCPTVTMVAVKELEGGARVLVDAVATL